MRSAWALGVCVFAIGCGSVDDRPFAWGYTSPAILQPSCATPSCHSRAVAVAGLNFSDPDRGYTSLTALQVWIANPQSSPDAGACQDVGGTTFCVRPRPLVIPFDPAQSRLVNMLRARGAPRMPPDRPLTETDIKLVESWILDGARRHPGDAVDGGDRPVRGTLLAAAGLLAPVSMLACAEPAVPAHPTWANVQPILAGQCSGCHGATAAATGAGYRFDFYDMTTDVCGEATQAIGADTPMAQALSPRIWEDVTTTADQPGVRPKMPPEPAPYLAEWEWKTIRGWLDDGTPKGDLPPGNHPARFRFYRSAPTADQSLDITALAEDPDGDPVVGVLKLGDVTLRMDRSGSFSARLDTSTWPAGDITVSAVLCDGWSSVDYTVARLTVSHAP